VRLLTRLAYGVRGARCVMRLTPVIRAFTMPLNNKCGLKIVGWSVGNGPNALAWYMTNQPLRRGY